MFRELCAKNKKTSPSCCILQIDVPAPTLQWRVVCDTHTPHYSSRRLLKYRMGTMAESTIKNMTSRKDQPLSCAGSLTFMP